MTICGSRYTRKPTPLRIWTDVSVQNWDAPERRASWREYVENWLTKLDIQLDKFQVILIYGDQPTKTGSTTLTAAAATMLE